MYQDWEAAARGVRGLTAAGADLPQRAGLVADDAAGAAAGGAARVPAAGGGAPRGDPPRRGVHGPRAGGRARSSSTPRVPSGSTRSCAGGWRTLDLGERLGLVRQLAETLQYAHARRLYHQALTPQSVLVAEPEADRPQLKLFNWQAGTSELTTETRLTVGHVVEGGAGGRGRRRGVPRARAIQRRRARSRGGGRVLAGRAGVPPGDGGAAGRDSGGAAREAAPRSEGLRPSEVADGDQRGTRRARAGGDAAGRERAVARRASSWPSWARLEEELHAPDA